MPVAKNPGGKKGNGATYRWIAERIRYEGDDCIQWPFCRLPQGPGMLGYNGKQWRAARLMCFLAHGAPPDASYEAAHSCGNGHLACMNPNHLSWKTRSENRLDSNKHGTTGRNFHGSSGKLTFAQAEEIRALRGKETGFVLAERYGVHFNTIYMIWSGKTFKSAEPVKNPKWTPAEDAKLIELTARRLSNAEVASILGRPAAHLHQRRRKLGISFRRSPQ